MGWGDYFHLRPPTQRVRSHLRRFACLLMHICKISIMTQLVCCGEESWRIGKAKMTLGDEHRQLGGIHAPF